jgi:hypothetical protein
MLQLLLSFFAGPLVKGLIDAYKLRLESQNTQDAKATELAIKEIEAEVKARAEASKIIAIEQGWWLTASIRPLLAFPVIIYFWKVIVWDKVFGWGTTDPILGTVGDWAGWIVVAYIGGRTIEKVSRVFANR